MPTPVKEGEGMDTSVSLKYIKMNISIWRQEFLCSKYSFGLWRISDSVSNEFNDSVSIDFSECWIGS